MTWSKISDGQILYTNPYFSSQSTGATDAGLIRGGYHFAHPDPSTSATQASYLLKHGGGWSADGVTLQAFDIESLTSRYI